MFQTTSWMIVDDRLEDMERTTWLIGKNRRSLQALGGPPKLGSKLPRNREKPTNPPKNRRTGYVRLHQVKFNKLRSLQCLNRQRRSPDLVNRPMPIYQDLPTVRHFCLLAGFLEERQKFSREDPEYMPQVRASVLVTTLFGGRKVEGQFVVQKKATIASTSRREHLSSKPSDQ